MLVFINTKGNKMIIKDLNQMEAIVNNNKKVLSWDGWSVVEMYPSEKGRSAVNGAYKNNKWFIKKVFTPSQVGWEIPNKYVR
jgi:hypothetical protein